ncbi:MAG: tRNA (N6-isopentenyl adenosine(37)-C2)-methylthiotransferase MiaB [Phycisphaerae bacterium]
MILRIEYVAHAGVYDYPAARRREFEEWLSLRNGSYYLETFGCQMNTLDSQLVEGQLRARGLRATSQIREADLVLFNTCSVRQHAEDKVLSRLGALGAVKRRRPEMIVGVIGCMAEREKDGLLTRAPVVDLLCGPAELNRLPALLDEVHERRERVAALTGTLSRRTEVLARALEYDSLEALDLSREPAPDESVLQSYIRVQRGCDKFCTYCVVPFTRGPERSRPPGHIVEEARRLAQRGCREVTLLGQTVNSYVHQEDGRPVRFARLLERVHEVEGIDRIRFVTSFPADWDEDIFRVLRDCPRVMPYLHIPAQSGSDTVLRRMKRGYSVADYLRLIDAARRHLPHISLAGDFIVGFCGETDRDFQQSIELLERVEYKSVFVFKYSPRPGTAAERAQDDDVSDDAKRARNIELLGVQERISLRHRQALVGRTVEILVEGPSKISRRAPQTEQERDVEVAHGAERVPSRTQLVGRTPGDLIVVFDGDAAQIGALAQVRIERASPLTLFGTLESIASPPRAPRPLDGKLESPSAAHGLPILSAGSQSPNQ